MFKDVEEDFMVINFTLNGERVSAPVDNDMRLLDLLRDYFKLTGAKEGCGQGECGACTVIMDGRAVNACLIPVRQVEGTVVLTIEGLGKDGEMDIVQKAFLKEGAIQCGYCSPGMIMSVKALLMNNPNPSRKELVEAIAGNICRCTGYTKIIKAAETAAEETYAQE
jgi:carbon-monoxide dehydrogenase small subunit